MCLGRENKKNPYHPYEQMRIIGINLRVVTRIHCVVLYCCTLEIDFPSNWRF